MHLFVTPLRCAQVHKKRESLPRMNGQTVRRVDRFFVSC